MTWLNDSSKKGTKKTSFETKSKSRQYGEINSVE